MATMGGRAPRPAPDATRHHHRWVVPAVIVGIIGLIVVLILQFIDYRHTIQRELTSTSVAALHDAGIDGVTVTFTGRDGTIYAPTDATGAQAKAVIEQQDGVRVVHVVVGPPPGSVAAPTPTPTLTLVVTPGPSLPPSATPSPSASPTATPTPTGGGQPGGGLTAAQVQTEINALPKIHFAFAKATLNSTARATIAKVATILLANPSVRVQIQGNADSTGPADFNLTLSRQRALSVYKALRALGVPASQMSTIGYGETHPLVPNDTAAHRALNRRVDFKAE